MCYDEIPNIKPESEKDPKEYFKALLSTQDKWFLITDDVDGLLENMTRTGDGLAYGQFLDSETVLPSASRSWFSYSQKAETRRYYRKTKLTNSYTNDLNKLTLLGTLKLGMGK